jgi:hypothetical protein
VKLIHNAIEFGMVQAIAEGIDLLTRSDYPLNLPALNSSKHSTRRKPVTRSSDKWPSNIVAGFRSQPSLPRYTSPLSLLPRADGEHGNLRGAYDPFGHTSYQEMG